MSDVKQLKIEEYSLVDFVMKIQQGILDGYEVNDSSDDAPIQIGGAFHLIMREKSLPPVFVGKLALSMSVDADKFKEQLKVGGEIEQMIADSLVVEEKLVGKTEDLHETLMGTIPITEAYVETIEPPKEPTLDESLPKEEQAALQTKQPTKRGKK
mgnify:CR=1 FL=1